MDSVDLYEIKDSELDLLEKGSPADLNLNFTIGLFSTAVSIFVSLAAADYDAHWKTVFTIVAIVCCLFGLYTVLMWRRSRVSHEKLCRKIRDRIPPDSKKGSDSTH